VSSSLRQTFIKPSWPVPANVQACVTTRTGGVSSEPYVSLNLADHVGDSLAKVQANRATFLQALAIDSPQVWIRQVHGLRILDLDAEPAVAESGEQAALRQHAHQADGVITTSRRQLCIIQSADCLPVLMCDAAGTQVAAIHAGWRGLAGGIIQNAVSAFKHKSIHAWLGPAIGPQWFEVGAEVRDCFIAVNPKHASEFTKLKSGSVVDSGGRREAKWLANLYGLASQQSVSYTHLTVPTSLRVDDSALVCTLVTSLCSLS